jgi:hypothetical protein
MPRSDPPLIRQPLIDGKTMYTQRYDSINQTWDDPLEINDESAKEMTLATFDGVMILLWLGTSSTSTWNAMWNTGTRWAGKKTFETVPMVPGAIEFNPTADQTALGCFTLARETLLVVLQNPHRVDRRTVASCRKHLSDNRLLARVVALWLSRPRLGRLWFIVLMHPPCPQILNIDRLRRLVIGRWCTVHRYLLSP